MIAEITGGYVLFVPLMIVSTLAYTTATVFDQHSIYTEKLIERGQWLRHDKDKQLLGAVRIDKMVEKDLLPVRADQTLGELLKRVARSRRNIFPVPDAQNHLLGIIALDDIRQIMFDTHTQRTVRLGELMHAPPAEVSPDERMTEVMEKFERTQAWNLPVVDNNIYVGFLSKSTI